MYNLIWKETHCISSVRDNHQDSSEQQLKILDQNIIIYYYLHFWIAKKQRLKVNFLQPLFFLPAESKVAFILGDLDPFFFVQCQNCSGW